MGRYTKIRKAGSGGEGEVWLVKDNLTGSARVALKYILDEDETLSKTHLANEFHILSSLSHPAIARVFDFGREARKEEANKKTFYFTRQFIEGRPLAPAFVKRAPEKALAVFVEILRALKPLHRSGIVHGDLKPSNIIMTAEGGLRLIDFSLSEDVKNPEKRASGTLRYMAPEIILGEKSDTRCDIYSAGVIFLEMLLGHHPLKTFLKSSASLIQAHIDGKLKIDPGSIGRGGAAARKIAELASLLVMRDPSRRPANVEEIEASIRKLGVVDLADDPYDRRSPIAATAGRQIEKESIIRTLRRLADRGALSSTVSITGPPGSGKSAMLREIKWHLEMEAVPLVELAFEENDNLSDIMTSFGNQLLWQGEGFSAQPASKTSGGIPENPGPDDILGAVENWPRRVPVTVLLDDVDRAPSSFMELMGMLLSRKPDRGFIFIAAMDSASETLFNSLPIEERRHAALSPASEEEISTMLKKVAGRDDPATVRWIKDMSGGNYAIASEAIEYVATVGPSFDIAEGKSLTRSRWLAERWKEKFDTLTEDQRALVTAVALHCEPVSPQDAAEITGLDDIKDVTERLGRDFLRWSAAGRIEMSSQFLKNVIRDLLSDRERRSIHEKWAGTLRGRLQSTLPCLLHTIRSGKVDEVYQTALEEAKRKKLGGRVKESILLLDTLLRSVPSGSEKAVEPQLLLAAGFLEAGRVAEAMERLDSIKTGESAEHGLKKKIFHGACLIASGGIEKGIEIMETVAASRAAPEDLKSEAIVYICDALLRKGDYDSTLEWVKRGMKLDHPGAEQNSISLLCTKGSVYLYRHRKKMAMENFNRALELASRQRENTFMIKVLGYKAMAEQMWGNLQSASALYGEAIDLCRAQGHTGKLAQNYLNLATIYHRRGDFEKSINYYLSAIDYAEQSGQRAILPNARINYCMVLGFLGMIQQAGYEIGRAEKETSGLGQKVLEARALAVSAEIAARGGDFAGAAKKFKIADRIFETTGNRWEEAEVKLEIVDTLLPTILSDIPRHREAEIGDLLEKAGVVALEAEGSLLSARYGLARAKLLFLQGKGEESREYLQQALETCRNLKDEFDDFTWQIHFLHAQMKFAEKDYDNACRHTEKAAASIESLEEKLPERFRLTFRKSLGRQKVFEMLEVIRAGKSGRLDAYGPLRQMILKLMRINSRIAAERDINSLIDLILDSAIDVTGAERGFLLMPDESGKPEVTVARDFDTLSVPKEHIEFSTSIASKVLMGGESVFTISASSDERFSSARSVHELGLQSIVCIPIKSEKNITGAIYLEHHSAKALLIPPEEKNLLHAFADQAAIAMENARLLRDNLRRIEEIRVLSEERARLLEKRTKALREAKRFLKSARDLFSQETTFRGIVGASSKMKKLFETIKRLDESEVPVVITGESGTGKELVARAIHDGSNRRKKDFIAINCGALPPQLLESELFGYARGAFTGATGNRKGIFSTASGGTLLLDEIAQMPLRMQVDLLRVLQEGKVRPVGANHEEKVNVRVLAASQPSLEKLVKKGAFRRDLYYRLSVVSIHLPPLRERVEDIPLLVDYFLSGFSVKMKTPRKVISKKALKFLMDYPWYGNVRELENAILSAWVLEEGKFLDLENFAFLIDKERLVEESEERISAATHPTEEEDQEKEKLLEALKKCGWNKSRAARSLGIPRRTFYRKLKRYGIM